MLCSTDCPAFFFTCSQPLAGCAFLPRAVQSKWIRLNCFLRMKVQQPTLALAVAPGLSLTLPGYHQSFTVIDVDTILRRECRGASGSFRGCCQKLVLIQIGCMQTGGRAGWLPPHGPNIRSHVHERPEGCSLRAQLSAPPERPRPGRALPPGHRSQPGACKGLNWPKQLSDVKYR